MKEPKVTKQQEDVGYREDINRRLRAVELGIPLTSTWSQISFGYMSWTTIPDVKNISKRNGAWVHPCSSNEITGTLLRKDFEELRSTDMFAHPDGTWRPCGYEGIIYRSFIKTPWVRPE